MACAAAIYFSDQICLDVAAGLTPDLLAAYVKLLEALLEAGRPQALLEAGRPHGLPRKTGGRGGASCAVSSLSPHGVSNGQNMDCFEAFQPVATNIVAILSNHEIDAALLVRALLQCLVKLSCSPHNMVVTCLQIVKDSGIHELVACATNQKCQDLSARLEGIINGPPLLVCASKPCEDTALAFGLQALRIAVKRGDSSGVGALDLAAKAIAAILPLDSKILGGAQRAPDVLGTAVRMRELFMGLLETLVSRGADACRYLRELLHPGIESSILTQSYQNKLASGICRVIEVFILQFLPAVRRFLSVRSQLALRSAGDSSPPTQIERLVPTVWFYVTLFLGCCRELHPLSAAVKASNGAIRRRASAALWWDLQATASAKTRVVVRQKRWWPGQGGKHPMFAVRWKCNACVGNAPPRPCPICEKLWQP